MPKWKKNETVFNTKVSYNEHRGYQCYMPRPIMEKLGKPDYIKFIVGENKITVEAV